MNTKTEKTARPAPNDDGFVTRTIRTFLVEDSPSLMASLARIVARNPRIFVIGSAMNDRKALCDVSTLQPDLVITHPHVSGMGGAEAARRLRHLPNPPIIFVVSGEDKPEARARSTAAGADAYLVRAGNLAPRLLSAIQEFFPDDLERNYTEPKHLNESLTPV
jgi:two-component system chemotaxis response regulator CheB